MLCQKCGVNEANVHMVQVVNGKRFEQHLCNECASNNNLDVFDPTFSMNKLLSNFFEPQINETQQCNNCGMSYNDFTKSGLLGCYNCYDTFKKRLDEPLKRLHGTATHKGKRLQNKESNKSSIENLQKQLQNAIKDENYELAAELRDRIKEMEGK